MTWSIGKAILAVVIAVATGIVLVSLVGPILADLKVPIAETVGKFFESWGFVIGVLCGLWFYFASTRTA